MYSRRQIIGISYDINSLSIYWISFKTMTDKGSKLLETCCVINKLMVDTMSKVIDGFELWPSVITFI